MKISGKCPRSLKTPLAPSVIFFIFVRVHLRPFAVEPSVFKIHRSRLVRIPQTTRQSIKSLVSKRVPNSECYLFGSRTLDDAKGGDIDLLLLTPEQISLRQILTLRREILNQIGEQKIDIVNFPKTSNHPFLKVAMDGAIPI